MKLVVVSFALTQIRADKRLPSPSVTSTEALIISMSCLRLPLHVCSVCSVFVLRVMTFERGCRRRVCQGKKRSPVGSECTVRGGDGTIETTVCVRVVGSDHSGSRSRLHMQQRRLRNKHARYCGNFREFGYTDATRHLKDDSV